MQGKIKFYDKILGLGFIFAGDHCGDNKRTEYFFHLRARPGGYEPQVNDFVSFELSENNPGACAIKIQKL